MEALDTIKIYNQIKEFVISLNECYGENFINIKLYNRLMEKTLPEHIDAISKHVYIFEQFCKTNETNIVKKNYDFVQADIKYSEKVYLNMKEIFETSDDRDVLWKYIYNISVMVNPKIEAKQMLNEDTSENNFLLDIMDKVERNIDPNSTNPMEAITSMMSSGVFSDLVGTMTSNLQSGDLNLGSLMGTMNTMMSGLSNEGGMGQSMGQSMCQGGKKRRNNKKKKPKRK